MEQELRNRVENKILECLCKAEDVFRKTFPMIEVRYNLRGTCAGQYCYQRTFMGVTEYFKLNSIILSENVEHYISQTVPHEVAHYIVRSVFGRVQSHGAEWQGVMTKIFGLDSKRCHNYDVSNSKRKVRKHVWGCGCKDYKLSSQKHNRVLSYIRMMGVPVGHVLNGYLGCRVCGSHQFTYKGMAIA